MGCGETKKANTLDFRGRVNQEQEPKGNFKQYGVLLDQICCNKTPTVNDAKQSEIIFLYLLLKEQLM